MYEAFDTNLEVRFVGKGRIELAKVPIPDPGPDQILVRNFRTLISTGTELTLLSADVPPGSVWASLREFPLVPGYSSVGEVMAVGTSINPDWVGRRVHSHAPHARYALSAFDKVAELPPEVDPDHATFTSLAKVAMNGLRRVRLSWGECVVVVGLGIVGQLALRICGVIGTSTVLGIDPAPLRLELAVPAEASLFGGPLSEAPQWVMEQSSEGLADVVIESTGRADAIAAQVAMLRPHGRLLILSSPRGPSQFDFHDGCNRNSFTIVGAHGFSHPPVVAPDQPWTSQRHGRIFLEWLARGIIDVDPMVTHRFDCTNAVAAYELLLERRSEALGVILDWSK